MKALVIAPQPFFSPRGTPMSVYYRALVMARKGVKIDLLTYGEGQDVEIPGVRIVRIPAFPFLGHIKTGPSLLKLFLDVFITLWMLGMLIRNRYDFVHAHEEAAFITALLRPIFRYRFLYDMHSSLPEQLRNFGWTRSKILIGFFEWAEDGALRSCDAVITICPALADYAVSRIEDPDKHYLIENSIFEPVRLADAASSTEQEPDVDSQFDNLKSAGINFVPVYAGTLETYQGIDLLLESMAVLSKRQAKVGLIVVGGSPEQVQRYRDMAQRLGIAEICRFTGRVPQKVARAFTERADILLSPRTRGMNTPLKTYEQLASGQPLVATRIPSHTQVLSDDVAFLADPDPESFAGQMELAVSDADLAARKVRGALTLYERAYSPAVYASKIDKVLDRLGQCAE